MRDALRRFDPPDWGARPGRPASRNASLPAKALQLASRLISAAVFLFLTESACWAAPSKARQATMCAYEAQSAVSRRHGLSKTHGSSASKVYADPQMSQEADNAFDACVRRQAARPGR
jgi:hypothetical protein